MKNENLPNTLLATTNVVPLVNNLKEAQLNKNN